MTLLEYLKLSATLQRSSVLQLLFFPFFHSLTTAIAINCSV